MPFQPDFVVYSSDHTLQLTVEVKARKGASDTWAAHYRRNLVVHSVVPSSTSFLLATSDSVYLWPASGAETLDEPPRKISTREVLQPYLGTHSTADVSEAGLELAVKSWLLDVIHPASTPSSSSSTQWFASSGVYEHIKGGAIERPSYS